MLPENGMLKLIMPASYIAWVLKYRKRLMLVLSIIILLFLVKDSHMIRSVAYDQSPESNFLDEYTNIWHGLSIRTSGVPAAWSDLRSYWDFRPKRREELEGGLQLQGFNIYRENTKPVLFPSRNFPELTIYTTEFDFGDGKRHTSLMQPYLDHPPFGAIILSLLVPKTSDNFYKITPFDSRKTSIWLADLSTILIFLLSFQIFKNPLFGLISAAIYTSVPTYFFISRLALLENVLIPTQLISLNFIVFALNKPKINRNLYRLLLVISGIFAGLAFLSKTTGIAVILAGVIILVLYKERFKDILFFLLPAVFVSLIYFVWGMVMSPNLFPSLLIEQSSKRIFVGSLNFIPAAFKYGAKSFPIDGWWFGGFLSLIFLKYNKQLLPLIVSALAMLFMILFSGASSFPWYFIPLVPFLSIATANLLWNIATNPNLIQILILFLIFFSSTYFWAIGVFSANPNFINHQGQFFLYKVMLSFFFVAAVVTPFLHKRSYLFRIIWFIAMLLLIYVLIKWNFKSLFYMMQHWGKLIENFSPNWNL